MTPAERKTTPAECKQLRDLLAKATPGEWQSMRQGNQYVFPGGGVAQVVGASVILPLVRPWNPAWVGDQIQAQAEARFLDADADAIVTAHNALPGLLDDLDAAEAALAKACADANAAEENALLLDRENKRLREALDKNEETAEARADAEMLRKELDKRLREVAALQGENKWLREALEYLSKPDISKVHDTYGERWAQAIAGRVLEGMPIFNQDEEGEPT